MFAGDEEMVPSNSNDRSNDSSVLPVEDGDAGRWPHVMFDESELAGGDAGRWFVLALCLPDLLNFDIVSR